MTDKQQTDSPRVPTLNGRPTPLRDLNTNVPKVIENAEQGRWKRLVNAYRRLNQIMAGMYTGVGCSGVPHSHHTYGAKGSGKTRSTPSE